MRSTKVLIVNQTGEEESAGDLSRKLVLAEDDMLPKEWSLKRLQQP